MNLPTLVFKEIIPHHVNEYFDKIVFHGSKFAKYLLFTSCRRPSVHFRIFKDQRSPPGKKANYFILFNTGYPNVFDHRILFFFTVAFIN